MASDLRQFNVSKVIAFGSAIEGKSTNESDIDIVLIYRGKFQDFMRDKPRVQELLSRELSNLPFPIQFHPPQPGENTNVIHIEWEINDEIPFFAESGVTIWENKEEKPS